MGRIKSISVSNLYNKRFTSMPIPDCEFKGVLGGDSGAIPQGGIWIIHGDEKQGKTTLCLSLANRLSQTNRVLYIQAEQSNNAVDIDRIFVEAMHRAGITTDNRMLSFIGDISGEQLEEILDRKRSADIVFIDNITFAPWVNTLTVRRLSRRFKDKTFVYVAHNDRDGEPNGSTGKAIKRLANTVFSVEALHCRIIGRGSWGGTVNIDPVNGKVMHGDTDTGVTAK